MIDFDILRECGTTRDRLRALFTAEMPSTAEQASLGADAVAEIEKDVAQRKKIETMLSGWLQEHIIYSLANHQRYTAVDLAWDSCPINKSTLPLMMYAQGRINITAATKALKDMPDGDTYIKKNSSGGVVGIDLPKFTEMNINVLRSVITRRTAAQAVKYNLWPWFKYEPRSTTQVGKLRADLTNQRADQIADGYGYRHHNTQCIRNMFLYTEQVTFPRAPWERDVQWVKKNVPDGQKTVDGKIPKEAKVMREGISWAEPHRSRVFWDNNYPLASLNTDSGCEFVGFWDVARWGDIAHNPDYFNRERVSYSADTAAWFTTYTAYFNQYYDRIIPPNVPVDPTQNNDRKLMVGLYNGQMEQTATFHTHIWWKCIPNQNRMGSYPFPVWIHLKVAGDATVVYADIMPSGPCAVYSYNAHDGRSFNISLAHELMQFQDQLTNLYSQFLECIKADLFSVAVLNTDVFPESEDGIKLREEFRKTLTGKNFYATMQVLEASFEKMKALGINAADVFRVVRSTPNTNITQIFEAIVHVLNMADRLMVMSPHEQGQSASHEITASESNQMAGSTDTIYSFISEAVDEGRAAEKKILFESMIALGSNNVELPVINRYPESIITKAGFQVVEQDDDGDNVGYTTVMGPKSALVHDYIFTSRDGGDRPSNSQAATVLVQLVQGLGSLQPNVQSAILGAMGKEKVFEIFNTIFKLADEGIDLKLEKKAGDSDALLPGENEQLMQGIQQMAQQLQQNTMDVQQLKQAAQQIMQVGQQSQTRTQLREQINYKDAPPSIKRQMEKEAGFQPATDDMAQPAQQLAPTQ
jgi:hypothetical protein